LTPLHHAAKYGHDKVVQILVAVNANIEVKDNDGWTPLQYATNML